MFFRGKNDIAILTTQSLLGAKRFNRLQVDKDVITLLLL